MEYNKYQKRILKLAKFLGAVYSHIVPIAIVAAVVAATAVTLVATKGNIINQEEMPAEVTLGEIPELKSSSFLGGEVTYEYCLQGSDTWTTEVPKNAGTYQVRAVGLSSFGNPKYGKVQEFVIKPREITVAAESSTVKYGDTPIAGSDELMAGDSIAAAEFLYESNTATSTKVKVDAETVRIVNEKGEDVSGNYTIVDTPTTSIKIVPRDIQVIVDSASKIYDNTVLTCEGFELGETPLVGSDTLVAVKETLPSITDYGKEVNKVEFRVVNNGEDVSAKYNIKVVAGELSIEKKVIEVTSADFSAVYDGTKKSNPNITVNNTADKDFLDANGHVINVDSYREETNVFSGKNDSMTFSVKDKYGNDKTENYSILLVAGSFEIQKRAVTVTTAGADSYTYSNSTYKNEEYSVSNLPDGYTEADFVLSAAGSFIDANTEGHINERKVTSVMHNGSDETSNFDITYDYGRIVIKPRDITVTIAPNTQAEVTYGERVKFAASVTDPAQLLGSHRLEIALDDEYSDVGKYTCDIKAENIKISNGTSDVTSNYNVKLDDINSILNVEIIKRSITVKANNSSREFDGTALTDIGWSIADDSLAFSDAEEVTVSGSITDVGKVDNVITSYKIMRGGKDVTDNYNITPVDGSLTITKRTVTVKIGIDDSASNVGATNALEWTVGGKYSTIPAYGEGLMSGYTLVMPYWDGAMPESIGTYTGTVSKGDIYIKNPDGSIENMGNYDIICPDTFEVTLKITGRVLTVSAQGGEKEYDGETWDTTEGHSVAGGLFDGHSIYIEYSNTTSITEVGNIKYYIKDVKVYDGDVDVTYLYDISWNKQEITYTVTRRALTVKADKGEGSKVYDGKEWNALYNVVGELVDGHEMIVTFNGDTAITNVGRITFGIADVLIKDKNGNDVTDQYGDASGKIYDDVRVSDEVTKKLLTVVADNKEGSKVYDGKEWKATYKITDGSLLAGHTMSVYFNGDTAITNVGRITFGIADVLIKDKDGNDVTDQYGDASGKIYDDVERVSYEVTKKLLTVVADNKEGSKVYDGKEWKATYKITDGSLLAGHSISVDFNGETAITDAGIIEFGIGRVVIKDGEGNVVTEQYGDASGNIFDNTEKVTFEVKKRRITVTAESSEDKEYIPEGYTFGNPEITGEGMVGEERLKVVPQTLTDIGTHIINYGGKDTFTVEGGNINNYDVAFNSGYITITKRALKITAAGGTAEAPEKLTYKAEDHVYSPTDLKSVGLLAGHKFADDVFTEQKLKNAVNYVINYNCADVEDIRIVDADGNDVTALYDVANAEFIKGNVTIEKLTLKFTSNSYEWIYNGKAHEASEISTYTVYDGEGRLAGIPAGDSSEFKITNTTTVTNAESKANEFNVVIDQSVIDNYNIEKTYGTLTVKQRTLNITFEGDQFRYNIGGTVYTESNIIFDGKTRIFDVFEVVDCDAENDIFTLKNIQSLSAAQDITENPAQISKVYIDDDEYDWDAVRDNFKVEERREPITIKKRTLKITFHGGTFTFDGTERVFADVTVWEGFDASGDLFEYEDAYRQTNAVKTKNERLIKYVTIDDNRYAWSDVEDSFDAQIIRESIVINKRSLNITFKGGEYIFDGEYHKFDGVHIDTTCDAYNDVFTYSAAPELRDVKYSRENDRQITIVMIGDETFIWDEVKDNFDVVENREQMDIKKRSITLTTPQATLVYNGNAQCVTGEIYEIDPTLDFKFTLAEENFREFVNADIYDNAPIGEKAQWNDLVVITILANGENANADRENFEFKWDIGKVTVKPMPITVRFESNDEKTFNGEEYTFDDIEVTTTAQNNIDGFTFSVVSPKKFINAGTYTNQSEISVTKDGVNVPLSNFEPTYVAGTVIIAKRVVNITFEGDSYTIGDEGHEIPDEGLFYNGQTYEFDVVTVVGTNYDGVNEVWTFKDVGAYNHMHTNAVKIAADEYKRVASSVTIGGVAVDINANYSITYIYEPIEIKKASLTVTFKTLNSTYDGSIPKYTYTEGYITLSGGHADNTYDISYTPDTANVGTHNIKYECVITRGGVDVTDNYNITYVGSVFEIEPRELTVKLNSHWANDSIKYKDEVFNGLSLIGDIGDKWEIVGGDDVVAGHSIMLYTACYEHGADCSFAPGGHTLTLDFNRSYVNNGDIDISNYKITIEGDSSVTVIRRDITVTPLKMSYEFDGKTPTFTLAEQDVRIDGVNDPERIFNVTYKVDGIYAGKYDTLIFTLTAKNGESLDYYNIWFDGQMVDSAAEAGSGTWNVSLSTDMQFEITKRKMTVTFSGDEYHAGSYPNGPFDSSSDVEIFDGSYRKYDIASWLGASEIAGENVVFGEAPVYINAGEYGANNREIVKITVNGVELEGDKIAENYDITYNRGIIVIEKLPITITLGGGTFEYDGKEHVFNGITISPEITGDLDGDTSNNIYCMIMRQEYDFEFSDAPKYTNVIKTQNNRQLIDITCLGESAYNNFEVTIVCEDIEITKKEITITPEQLNVDRVYDGTAPKITFKEAAVNIVPQLVSGHDIMSSTLYYTTRDKDASAKSHDIRFGDLKIYDATTNADVTENYNIIYVEDGYTITITKRPLDITFGSLTADYIIGETYSAKEYTLAAGQSLAKGHDFDGLEELYPVYEIMGSHKNIIDKELLRIVDADGNPVTDNYEISVEAGVINIFGEIEVFLPYISYTYDGDAHEYHEALPVVEGLPEGFVFKFTAKMTSVGTADISKISSRDYVILDSMGNDISEGIEVKFSTNGVDGVFMEILKRKITVTAPTATVNYDDEISEEENIDLAKEDYRDIKPNGDFMGNSYTCGILCVKEEESVEGAIMTCETNVVNFVIKDANGADITDNYEVIFESGSYTFLEQQE